MTPRGDGATDRRAIRLSGGDGVAFTATHGPIRPDLDPLLVALPMATTEALVAPAVARLSERFNVFTWEARLVLESADPPAPGALAIPNHVADAVALLDRFGVATARVVGYCSGASLALHLAAAHPNRVGRLALVNGAYFPAAGRCERTQYERDVIDLMPTIAGERSRAEFVFARFFQNRPPADAGGSDGAFVEEFHRPYRSAEGLYRYAVALAQFCAADPVAVARAVRAPTLVASGLRDDRTHHATSAWIAAAIPGAELSVDEAGDHYEFARAKPASIDRLVAFLGGT